MAKPSFVVGWREWVTFPDLEIALVKAKVDTGARTSALHAEDVEKFRRRGKELVRFVVHPEQRSRRKAVQCVAPLAAERTVRSSNGQSEYRPVIHTTVQLGERSWTIELTLTNRDSMGFRMLLGRQAIRGHALVDPGRAFLTRRMDGKKRAKRP